MLDQQVGHRVKSKKILVNNLQVTFVTRFVWNLVRMLVLTVSRPSSNMTIIVYTSKANAFKFGPLVQLSLWNWTLPFYNFKLDPLTFFYILKV